MQRYERIIRIMLVIFSMMLLIYIGTTLFKSFSLDFTEDKLYTISDGTKKILQTINAPINLKLYYSKTAANKGTEGLRQFNNYFEYVKVLLENLKVYSRNNLKIQVIDPRPDTQEEEDAIASGLKRFSISESEQYFFGLVARTEGGTEKVIEFFDPNQKDRLEYDLIKLIYSIQNPNKKNIGVISSIDIINDDLNPYAAQLMQMEGQSLGQSWLIFQLAKEFYNFKKFTVSSDKIEGVDALMIVHPKGFSEQTLKAIDKYIVSGGKALIFVDSNVVTDPANRQTRSASISPDQSFNDLLKKWGIEVINDQFVGDKYLSAVGRFNPTLPPMRMIGLLNCDGRCVDGLNEPVTSNISNLLFVFPGGLKQVPNSKLTIEDVLQTTDKGGLYFADPMQMGNPQMLWNNFSEGSSKISLGKKISGNFESAYGYTPESKKDGAIFIYADVDFMNDQFAFQNSLFGVSAHNDNYKFILNNLDLLSGSTELMKVRSKGKVKRNFDVIDAIEFDAEKKTEVKVREIQNSIAKFQQELQQLGRKASDGNVMLVRNEGIQKQKELEKQIALLKKDLRNVKKEGRETVEAYGKLFQTINTVLMPLLIVVVGIVLARMRANNLKEVK